MTAGNTIAMEGIFSWMKGVAVFLIFSGFLPAAVFRMKSIRNMYAS